MPKLFRLSLFWRTFFLMTLLLFGSAMVLLNLFRVLEYEPRVLRNATQIASIVNLTRGALANADVIARVSLLKTLADEENVRILSWEPSDEYDTLDTTEQEKNISTALIQYLGTDTVVASRVNQEQGLWVGFSIERDSYWLLMDPERLTLIGGETWLLWWLSALGFSVIGALLLSSLLSKPLKNLAQATRLVSLGRHQSASTQLLDESVGSPEIREVNIGFNRMAAQLAQAEQDRALMLAGISHDLRTPLARLRLEIELAVADEGSRDAMSADIEQVDAILSKFLDYARSEHMKLQNTPLAAVVSRCMAPFGQLDTLRFSVHIPEDVEVLADEIELGRVISNVLENARRYGSSVDGLCRIDIEAHKTAAGTLLLVLRDHGPGVAPDQLSHLSQPFFRGNDARTAAMGSGLGLAIAERTMLRMGGRCTISNHPEGGLQVGLTLQLATR
jgi:two-component system, OmpR family, osmolarity sensor histidine kinase EnvZ